MTTPTSEEVKALVAIADDWVSRLYHDPSKQLISALSYAITALEIEREGMREDRRRRQQDYEAAQELIDASIKRNMFVNASLSAAEGALREIKALKPSPIAEGFVTGPQALLNAAQRIAAVTLRALKVASIAKPDTETTNTAEGEAFLAQKEGS